MAKMLDTLILPMLADGHTLTEIYTHWSTRYKRGLITESEWDDISNCIYVYLRIHNTILARG